MAHLRGVWTNKMDNTWMLTKMAKNTVAMYESMGMEAYSNRMIGLSKNRKLQIYIVLYGTT